MRKNSIAVALGLCAVLLLATAAPAQHKKTKAKHVTKHTTKKVVKAWSGAETSLAGIKLFDTGTRVVSVYGSPDVIEAVTLGGGGAAGPNGGAAFGPGGGGGTNRGNGNSAATTAVTHPDSPGDFAFGDAVLDMQKGGIGAPGQEPGPSPRASGGGGGGGGGNGGAGGPGGLGSSDRVMFTRWVYNRNASKYAFIMDKYNHVVQCEAIGIQAGKAKTRRGITFGSSFAQIIKAYGPPDGYEIAGDNVVVRYLSHAKCAFRLNRLGENKPDVVTGIVVAAGKR